MTITHEQNEKRLTFEYTNRYVQTIVFIEEI